MEEHEEVPKVHPLVKGRCSEDTLQEFMAEIQLGPHKFIANGSEVAGINAVISTITTLAALMNQGVKVDYTKRVAVGVLSRVFTGDDPHIFCPLFAVINVVEAMMRGEAVLTYDEEGDVYQMIFGGDTLLASMNKGRQVEIVPPSGDESGGGIFGGLT
jgi:hypothetical protein